MTKEELIKKCNSLENEWNELEKKINSLNNESRRLIAENVKNLLSVEAGDIIFEKNSGDAYKIYDIFIQDNEIILSLEYCGMVDYDKAINDEEFLSNYMTESQWKEVEKKKEEDKEYQEFLRLKNKFERN